MLPEGEDCKEASTENSYPAEVPEEEYIKSTLRNMLLQKQNCVQDFENLSLLSDVQNMQSMYYKLSRLEENMCNLDEEERLMALEIIVTSQKTTLKFVLNELMCILAFLHSNQREKMEYMHLIKKALKRVKDSLTVMRRQLVTEEKMRKHYEENNKESIVPEILNVSCMTSQAIEKDIENYGLFFKTLRDMCVNGLYPGSVYHHRKSSLEILCLMQGLLDNEFKDIAWDAKQAEKVFHCLLLDTYEPNKNMAFNILKSLDISLLKLDAQDRVWEIVTIAIKLGNSIRPIDTMTAAYLLKISLLSPVLQDVIQTRYDLSTCRSSLIEGKTLQVVLLLLKELQKSLTFAKENIVMTATKHSLYGHLFCIRSLLNDCNLRNAGKENMWQDTIAELICVCLELSNAVSVIVNNSSPEGHLPMDLETINDMPNALRNEETVTPQMVLLCSWRTVKEVSLLFGQLVTKLPICGDAAATGLLTEDQIVKIGEHLVTLLSETKHRGAFEQAHAGFSLLCTRLWRIKNTSLSQLPKKWLRQTLYAITGFAQKNAKLCATRRSAGVPFMVQALLTTEPRPQKNSGSPTFHSVMEVLLRLAELETGVQENGQNLTRITSMFSTYEDLFEPSKYNITAQCTENTTNATEMKTHALNILRAIFRHSQLGELVNGYVADGFIAALKSCDGATWAERNAATLLFSALMIRVFGVQRTKDHINLSRDNKMTVRNFFERYSSLLSFIVKELQSFVLTSGINCISNIKRNVHPILLLLSRLYLGHDYSNEDIREKIDKIIDLVSCCAKSSVYETRELAARVLVPLLTHQTALDVTKMLVHKILSAQEIPQSLNTMHGYMLQISEIIKSFTPKSHTHLDVLLTETELFLQNLQADNTKHPCFPLATVYLDIIYELYTRDGKIGLNVNSIFRKLIAHIINPSTLKQGPGQELYKTSVIRLLLSILKSSDLKPELRDELSVPERIYLNILNASEHEVKVIAWSTVVDIINKIPCDYRKTLLKNHCLDTVTNSIKVLHKYNPELQDAIFDFLYNCLMCENEFWSKEQTTKREIGELVLNKIRVNPHCASYRDRETYLRLLGKSYVTLYNCESVTDECRVDIYSTFCDSAWISSLSPDFRSSIYSIIQEFYRVPLRGNLYAQLQWWTMLLQLLVDDNANVRAETSRFICTISGCRNAKCISKALDIFFEKFYRSVAHSHPEVGCVALFTWSFALSDDADYEMDQTDVFNKCRNYDFLDPVLIASKCVEYLKLLKGRCSFNEVLSAEARCWVNSRMETNFPPLISFNGLLDMYKDHLPNCKQGLEDALDPTYKDKLIQISTYAEYKDIK